MFGQSSIVLAFALMSIVAALPGTIPYANRRPSINRRPVGGGAINFGGASHGVVGGSSHLASTNSFGGASHGVVGGASHGVVGGVSHGVVGGASHGVVGGASHGVNGGASHGVVGGSSHLGSTGSFGGASHGNVGVIGGSRPIGGSGSFGGAIHGTAGGFGSSAHSSGHSGVSSIGVSSGLNSVSYNPSHYPDIVDGFPFLNSHPGQGARGCNFWCRSSHQRNYYCCTRSTYAG